MQEMPTDLSRKSLKQYKNRATVDTNAQNIINTEDEIHEEVETRNYLDQRLKHYNVKRIK